MSRSRTKLWKRSSQSAPSQARTSASPTVPATKGQQAWKGRLGGVRGRRSIVLAAGAGLVLGAAILALQGMHGSGPRTVPTTEVGAVPLAYWNGSRGTLADFHGKPLVLNFWASWCGACLAELPRFQQVYAKHLDQVAFLGVNLKDDPQQAEALRQRTGITFRLARDADGSVFAALGGYTMPTTVLIGADGRVRHTFNGEINAEELDAAIQQYLLQPA